MPIADYRAAKVASGLAPKSVNNHLAVLGACLNAAVGWELLARRPAIELLKTDPPDFDYLGTAGNPWSMWTASPVPSERPQVDAVC